MNLQNIATVAIVTLFALVYALGVRASQLMRRRPRYFPSRFRFRRGGFDAADAAQQLRAVLAASFERRRLLNNGEYQVFKIVEKEVRDARKGYRVFAQTCLGEILASSNGDAFHSINSKRVDILVVDQGGWPVAAIEYQGRGHFQGNAVQRDAVKKEALGRAGIRYIEITPDDSEDAIRLCVRQQLGWVAPGAAPVRETAPDPLARSRFGQRNVAAGATK